MGQPTTTNKQTEDKAMKSNKKEQLERQLKNALKAGSKSKAAWAIIQLERLEETTMKSNNVLVKWYEWCKNNSLDDYEDSEEFEYAIRNEFYDHEILSLDELLCSNNKYSGLNEYLEHWEYLSGIAYTLIKYEIPLKKEIENDKAKIEKVKKLIETGEIEIPSFPKLIKSYTETEFAKTDIGSDWTETTYYVYEDGDGVEITTTKWRPTCLDEFIHFQVQSI